MKKVVAIVQARTGSSRLPSKVLHDMCGKAILSHVLERAEEIMSVDQVVLACPVKDYPAFAHLWPHVHDGDEHDVLGRFLDAADQYEASIVVRITGDCPLLATDVADDAVKRFMAVGRGYVPWCQPFVPNADGFDVEVFGFDTLVEANLAAGVGQREHVTTVMRGKPCMSVPSWTWPDWRHLKLSVDTVEDYFRVKRVMEHLADKRDFTAKATVDAWLEAGQP